MKRAPLVILVSPRRLIDHELKANPEFLGNARKGGTYPEAVEVKAECREEGVYITIDPYIWQFNEKVIATVEYFDLRRVWEAEMLAAAESGGRAAVEQFPDFEKWALLRRLAELG